MRMLRQRLLQSKQGRTRHQLTEKKSVVARWFNSNPSPLLFVHISFLHQKKQIGTACGFGSLLLLNGYSTLKPPYLSPVILSSFSRLLCVVRVVTHSFCRVASSPLDAYAGSLHWLHTYMFFIFRKRDFFSFFQIIFLIWEESDKQRNKLHVLFFFLL